MLKLLAQVVVNEVENSDRIDKLIATQHVMTVLLQGCFGYNGLGALDMPPNLIFVCKKRQRHADIEKPQHSLQLRHLRLPLLEHLKAHAGPQGNVLVLFGS